MLGRAGNYFQAGPDNGVFEDAKSFAGKPDSYKYCIVHNICERHCPVGARLAREEASMDDPRSPAAHAIHISGTAARRSCAIYASAANAARCATDQLRRCRSSGAG